tara:strand:+ start:2919 stop:3986 length:1068 start_codon:yes stop_codon:yes gene_type:complete
MAHNIEQNDHLVLNKNKAWHGLGTIVEEAPTPLEALKLARLEWEVLESETMSGKFFDADGEPYAVNSDEKKMLIRSDDKSVLGIVGQQFVPIQNQMLAEMCYEIAGRSIGNTSVTVETAGSIRGGKNVWFLLHTDTIDVGNKGDLTKQYLALCNGNDGSMALSFLNTDIRIVCNNTFTHAINRSGNRTVTLRHTTNIMDSIPNVINQLKNGVAKQQFIANHYRAMADKELNTQQMQTLWTDVYVKLWGNPESARGLHADREEAQKAVERKHRKMVKVLGEWSETWQQEVDENGLDANIWTAYNAVTNYLDHDRPMRVRQGNDRADARIASNLFGASADMKQKVFDHCTGPAYIKL